VNTIFAPLTIVHPPGPGPFGHPQKFPVTSRLPVHTAGLVGLSTEHTFAAPVFAPSIVFRCASTSAGVLAATPTSSLTIVFPVMIVPTTGDPPAPLLMLIPALAGVAVSSVSARCRR
jgi:hypothetical protein